ncbi:ABC transporter ATP-binding protein [Corallincola holothuriorum]|uniref:ABC transporter ATP-binding protein n=1 Tax=Corallincola holothuriorum TaxID=2282215 RepID=A0A368NS29_9GAMM|nr:ABC transporter ATP-binding protein [Corallincola holothuriorum]RCU52474.1 ABC transporter ATP-binding protein [Corallincola holothuriorum]
MLKLSGVYKGYADVSNGEQEPENDCVIRGVDLSLASGKSLALMGASGSGKSTLLHLIGGMDQVSAGQIHFNDQRIDNANEQCLSAYRRVELGFVFQQFNLLPTLSVRDNIAFPRRLLGLPEHDDHTETLICRLALDDLLDRWPDQLSGGQQQRVAIARALAHQPKLLLADEPTGNLDDHMSHEVMALLVDLSRQAGSALIMVTHSREMANYLGSQMQLHDGQLEAI